MARLSTTFWYGTFHRDEDTRTAHLLPGLAWTAVIALLLGCRLNLPYSVVDPTTIHTTILNSLVAGQTWGRQALVGSAEFPLLTTVSLLFAGRVGDWVNMPATHVLLTVAQIWTLIYLLRMPERVARRALVAALVLCALASASVRSVVFALDPNWIAAVPAAAALYHTIKWHRDRALRDVVLLAVNCGILVFAGPAATATGLILLGITAVHLRRLKNAEPATDFRGIAFLLWMPFFYCAVLLLLANWLILRDAFFIVDRITGALGAQSPWHLTRTVFKMLTQTPWLASGAVVVTAFAVTGERRIIATTVLTALLVLASCHATLAALNLHVPGGHILLLVLGLVGLTLPAFNSTGGKLTIRAASAVAIVVLALASAIIWPHKNYVKHVNVIGEHPHRRDITRWVDDAWSRARIMVYGVKAPAMYVDLKEKRFVARIDYSDDAFLWRARTEQLYLLVPPCNGEYYAAHNSAMAHIHRHGKPWLLLEKQWPPGWQLWRCVMLPDSEQD